MTRTPEQLWFAEGGEVPNNPALPVLLYRGAIPPDAAAIERRLDAHGWPPQWRYGVFDYHHWHAEGHEVLAVAEGRARLLLGGPEGRAVDVEPGDVLLLPAGTGHCQLSASPDFLVVGAYPPGQHGDIRTGRATADDRARIASLPFPASDPVYGPGGSLTEVWR